MLVKAAEPVAFSSNPLQESLDYLNNGYSEYYDIHTTNLSLISSQEDNGITENTYLYEMTVTLKATSVEEMDYYKPESVKLIFLNIHKNLCFQGL